MSNPSRIQARRRSIPFLLALVLAIGGCATAPNPDGGDGGDDGGETGNALWGIIRPVPADPVDGFEVAVSGDTVTGTDSEPAGWTLIVSRPGGFVDLGTYTSAIYDDGSGTGDLTVTFEGPGGASCTVGPDNTSISEDGPNPGDTYAQVSYAGTAEGVPTLVFGVFSAACDDLPGASGSGIVDGYLFGMGAS